LLVRGIHAHKEKIYPVQRFRMKPESFALDRACAMISHPGQLC
jgi:hypothetical protein